MPPVAQKLLPAVGVAKKRASVGCENKLDLINFETKLKPSFNCKSSAEWIFISSFGSSVGFPPPLVLLFHQVERIKPGWSVSILFKFILSSFLLI